MSHYPDRPGWKARDTAKAAADSIEPRAPTIRERVLRAVSQCPGTPEDIAARIGEPVMNVRPRLSELSVMDLVEDSGQRGPAMGGKQAIVWRLVTPQTPPVQRDLFDEFP